MFVEKWYILPKSKNHNH